MKFFQPILLTLCLGSFAAAQAQSTTANATQSLALAGLRSASAQGQFNSITTDGAGDVYLLLDQKDGIRILEVANDGAALLAQAHIGAAGDTPVAMSLDPSGNVYVTGTSTSGSLQATNGAAITNATAGTTNSFVAKFDASLNETFLTYTGGSRIVASAIASSADAVFVTGITYGSDLPVTSDGIQQAPAYGSMQNGFVERFSADGSTLQYATYITGALGDTTPAAIAVDGTDDAWLVGSTSASGFPTVAALIPDILASPSGFVLRLTPAGDGIVLSTFVPGTGLTSIALDSTGQTLLISGNVALGQFPVDTVLSPLVPTPYQLLLRMPLDGSAVESGTVIAPGQQSVVTRAGNGGAWLGGDFNPSAAPLLPQPALSPIGSAYAARITSSGTIDQTVRFGGLANGNQSYASAQVRLNSLAVDPSGSLFVSGSADPAASSGLLATETYDLPLHSAPTVALPSTVKDAELTAPQCTGSLCMGSAGYLAKLDPAISSPSLALSTDDLPFVTLRNLGSSTATDLQLATSSGSLETTCTTNLAPGAQCDALLSGGTAGTLTASASGATTQTVAFGAYPATPPTSTIVFSPKELDFGIETSTSPAALQTLTVTNLGATVQTFLSGIATTPESTTPFTQATSDCPLSSDGTRKLLAPNATCHITIAFAAYSASNGFVLGEWSIGSRQVLLTGYSQVASLSVSASELDFGTQFQNGLTSPRYLYLSNSSFQPLAHAAVILPAGSAFTVTDGCPASIPAQSVCRIRVDYLSPIAPSADSISLALDQGLAVPITGTTLPPPSAGGSSVNPTLTLSTTALTFTDAVIVTGVSATQTVGITNTGQYDFSLAVTLTGDFTDTSSCGTTLAVGATCAVAIQFTPSQPGTRQGLLTVTAGAGTAAATVTLNGTATPILASNNGILSFGAVNQPLVRFYKITQPFSSLTVAATGPYRVTLIEDTGFGHGDPPSSSFVVSGTGTCRNCWLGIRFQPTAAGTQPGTLKLTSNPQGLPYTLVLSGSGIADTGLILSPALQDFGAIPIHSTTGTIEFTLTNASASASSVTVSSTTATGDFSISPTANAQPCTGTLGYSASCTVAVAFTATAAGTQTGTLAVVTSAGTISAPLTGIGTPDPGVAISPLALKFSNVVGTAAPTQTITITNTGSTTATLAGPTTTSTAFTASSACGILAPSASCTVQVFFTPTSAPASATLNLSITIPGSNGTPVQTNYTVALFGAYSAASAGLPITPNSISFGPTATLMQGPLRQFTITNFTGKSLTLATDVPHNYALVGSACTALAPGAACNFQIQSVPLTNGDLPGTISLTATPSDGPAPLISLAYAESFGVGTGALTLSGGTLVNGVFNFGQASPGQTITQTFTVANAAALGSPAFTIRRVTSAPPFLSSTTCMAPLAPGQHCTVTVTYTAGSGGSSSSLITGSLTIESDAQSSPDIINLAAQLSSQSSATADTPLLTFSLSDNSLTFPATTVGDASPAQTITLANTGNSPVTVAAVTAPADFSIVNRCNNVTAGATCNISIASTPQTAGTHLAALQIQSNAATSLEFVNLVSTGNPSPLSITPASLDFGSVILGAKATLPVQLENTGTIPIIFNSVATDSPFSVNGDCPAAGAALAPQASCTLQVGFAPTSNGAATGTLSLATSASTNPLHVALSGNGMSSTLVASPSTLAFGSIVIGASADLSLTLTNTGTANLTGLTLTPSADYQVTKPCPSSTLTPGSTCIAQIAFTPTALGARNAPLTISSSDLASPLVIPLTGAGISNGSFSLTVDNSSSADSSVKSGQSASFALLVTPTGAFTGSVALTCTPLQPLTNISCSLFPSLLGLANGAAASTATITTVVGPTAVAAKPESPDKSRSLLAILPAVIFLALRRTRLRRSLSLFLIACLLALNGCGGHSSSVVYAPAGTYRFQIAATSTSGVQIAHTVTLNLTVTPH